MVTGADRVPGAQLEREIVMRIRLRCPQCGQWIIVDQNGKVLTHGLEAAPDDSAGAVNQTALNVDPAPMPPMGQHAPPPAASPAAAPARTGGSLIRMHADEMPTLPLMGQEHMAPPPQGRAGATAPPRQAPSRGASNKRRHKRDAFYTRAKLVFKKGVVIHGITEDISAGGAAILLNNALDMEDISLGDEGVLEAVINEETQSGMEMPFKVMRLANEVVGLSFGVKRDGPGLDGATTGFKANTQVFVRRSGGRLEGGWEIQPGDAPLPATIERLYREMKNRTLCVVVKRKHSNMATYKIYPVVELKAIQDEAVEKDLGDQEFRDAWS